VPRYGNFLYGSGRKYGVAPRLQYNVDPFVSTAVDYGVVQLTWTTPTGDFFGVRIVRNQDGFPETAEDGLIAWEELHIDGVTTRDDYLDGVDNIGVVNGTIATGSFVYYTYWILNADNVWVAVASTYCLMPKSHGVMTPTNEQLLSTQDKFIGLLPRVFTTADQNPLGQADTGSDLYNFLYPFAFTLDEYLTYTDFLLPEQDFKHTDPNILQAKIQQLGIVREPNFSTKYQKRLLKNATYIYRHKGTKAGLKVFSESLTGYPVTLFDSPNKMLSLQDSTFKQGTGNWRPLKNVTILAVATVLTPTVEALAIEAEYSAKVVVGQADGKLQNGVESPVLQGVPVSASTEYSFSTYLQKSATTGNVTFKIYWYDYTGTLVATSAGDTATSIGTSWTKKTYTATSDADAAYAAVEIIFASTGTYYMDMAQFALSSATDFNEARGITAFLNPSKTNYITNPSFETYTGTGPYTYSGWTTDGTPSPLSSTAGGVYVGPIGIPIQGGTWMLKLDTKVSGTTTLSTASGDVRADAFYAFSIYGKLASGTSRSVTVTVNAIDSNTDVIATKTSTYVLQYGATVNSTPWTRMITNLQVPPVEEGVTVSLEVEIACIGGGDDLIFEGAQLEPGYLPSDYFDGDIVDGGAMWVGTDHDSVSYQYVGITEKLDRLDTEISKYIPLNSSYVIDSYLGVLATGLT